MGYFALVKDSKVTTVIVADQKFINACFRDLQADVAVDVTDARPAIGDVYDAESGTFSKPPQE